MDLVGAWLRQLLKAGTAAALVPAAMLAALAVVLFGAGGLGGLGSLGQLLSGPQITPAERVASGEPGGGRDVAPVAPADADAEASRRSDAGGRSRRRGGRVSPGPAAARSRPVVPAVDPGAPPRVRPPRVSVLPPPPPPPPPAATPRPPTLKERTQVLGDKLKDTVGDVGTAVEEIVDGLGQTLGRIGDRPPQLAP